MARSLLSTGKKKLLLVVAATMILQYSTATDGVAGNSSVARHGCKDKCGNVSIPYPFGIGRDCFREGFEVACMEDLHYSFPVLLKTANIDFTTSDESPSNAVLLGIDLTLGEARVQSPISWYCNYTNNTESRSQYGDNLFSVGQSFTVSRTKNKFTAIGCATVAFIVGSNNHSYTGGCISSCHRDGIDNSTQCTGMGCCQTSIPDNLNSFRIGFLPHLFSNRSFSPCSYGFIVDENWFNFDPRYATLSHFQEDYRDGVPLVLDWVVGKETCVEAQRNQSSYACQAANTNCSDASNGSGYLCSCSQGYDGNPYVQGGCQDINECDHPLLYTCNGKCKNTDGGYTCSCPLGTRSKDPKKASCMPNENMIIGLAIILVFIISCIFVVMTKCEQRKLAKEKERFFKQNGGQILYQQILSRKVDTVIIFTVEDLKTATNNFDKSRELGIGGHGAVYKGILRDNKVVAVKRSKISNVSQAEEFVQEIIILSQINHRNVVRLLGCCLEVEVPILVYEFIPNGTLFHFIHGNQPVSLDARLRIAQESAEALAYMHLSISHPIVHGDVKSLNILLDENYMAKVTDFGASRLLAKDEAQLMTMVQGTLGYLDPEYLQERKLTEKSDVYSFGVVLLELITRKTAIYSVGTDEEGKSLASSFVQAMKENRVEGMLDPSIMCVGMEDLLQEVVVLGGQCLSIKGEERPSMTQVSDKLKGIRSIWRELLLLKHNETELLIQNSGKDAACGSLSPSMYWTAGMMGMDIETPIANKSTYNMG